MTLTRSHAIDHGLTLITKLITLIYCQLGFLIWLVLLVVVVVAQGWWT